MATFVLVLGGSWAADDTITATVDNDDTKIMAYSVKKANHELLKVQADPGED